MRRVRGQGYAARETALAMPSCIGRNHPSKQYSTLFLAWDQRLRNCKSCAPRAQSWHLHPRILFRRQTLARILRYAHVLFLSIRNRCGWVLASQAPSARIAAPRTRGEIRPYRIRNSPILRDESTIAAIEMAAEGPPVHY